MIMFLFIFEKFEKLYNIISLIIILLKLFGLIIL